LDKLDKFYTKKAIVERCVSVLDFDKYEVIVEPSAGSGAFLEYLPKNKTVALDIEPDISSIIKMDFLDTRPPLNYKYLVIGNPPFGKNSSLAKKFFNHAATFADTIAFVLPRTFRKVATVNQLNLNFHKVHDELLPLESFECPDGTPYSVPCVFQIWKKRSTLREKINLPLEHPDFFFLEESTHYKTASHGNIVIRLGNNDDNDITILNVNLNDWKAFKRIEKAAPNLVNPYKTKLVEKNIEWKVIPDFVFRRAGGSAGQLSLDYQKAALEGNLFIKVKDKKVLDIFNKMWKDWWSPRKYEDRANFKWDTAGTPSISKSELIQAYIKMKEHINE